MSGSRMAAALRRVWSACDGEEAGWEGEGGGERGGGGKESLIPIDLLAMLEPQCNTCTERQTDRDRRMVPPPQLVHRPAEPSPPTAGTRG